MTTSELWILSEYQVARDRRLRAGEQLIAHRFKTPFAEVDLLLRSPRGVSLLEVKCCRSEAWLPYLLSRTQRRRLLRARDYLEDAMNEAVFPSLAAVDHHALGYLQPQISYFEIRATAGY